MENKEDKPIEKRHYQGKKNSDIVNFPVDLRRNFLSPQVNKEILDAPVSATRIIIKILNDISHDQFRGSNKLQNKQYSLFESDFKTENNTFARFTFKITDIAERGDYLNVKKGLEFLENYKKGWHESVNEKGKKIKSLGGFITNSNISDGKISFLMSSFFLEQVISLERYNPAYTEIAWKFTKSKQILFYLWLLEVPDKGTRVNFITFQEAYGYNYLDANTYAKNVLKSLKVVLDKYSNRSFNYSVKGDLINIIPFYTKDTELKISSETNKKQEIVQKLNYWKQRHNLSKYNIDILKSLINIDYSNFKLFQKAYSNILKTYRAQKIPIVELQENEFIKKFQEEIIETYKNSAWGSVSKNGYPTIE
ncbi:hypothetical protein [Flavobacterium daejeonense]|uniref:hypothetical protein n=1 Tax=Flavobacterium daejeonense TaxID=350893 RepID=UPI00047B77A0|nr:hypothetical protein [Flavobacterium daejeonense]